jgi:hypothetical protein
MAAREIFDRAFGRPREFNPKDEVADSLAGLTPAELKVRLTELLEFAASIEVPREIEGNDDSGTAIDNLRAERRPRTVGITDAQRRR